MVIYAAVGGRLSLFGAVWGTLLVNWAKTTFSESFPDLWLFGLGALFIAVVLAFPNGPRRHLAGTHRAPPHPPGEGPARAAARHRPASECARWRPRRVRMP